MKYDFTSRSRVAIFTCKQGAPLPFTVLKTIGGNLSDDICSKTSKKFFLIKYVYIIFWEIRLTSSKLAPPGTGLCWHLLNVIQMCMVEEKKMFQEFLLSDHAVTIHVY